MSSQLSRLCEIPTVHFFPTYIDLEYAGIWLITFVMSVGGMEAALLAGILCALLTFAIQSVAYPKPIRGSMTASTLRSSEWNRCPRAFEILDSQHTGRIRILVVQLQGHLFFGYVFVSFKRVLSFYYRRIILIFQSSTLSQQYFSLH